MCDEEWEYDDDQGLAVLAGFRMLCPDCNAVVHPGNTSLRGLGDVALEHMARVNGTTVEVAHREVVRETT